MAIYVGAIGPGPVVRVPMCFTGAAATMARNLIAHLEVFSGMLVGAVVGLIVSFILGPEVLPQLAGVGLGAIAGALAGGIITLAIIIAGGCTCPAGASGFCIWLLFYVVPRTGVWIPIWPFVFPNAGACTTLMPPGCP